MVMFLTESNKWGAESGSTSQAGGLSTSPRVSTFCHPLPTVYSLLIQPLLIV